MAKGKSFFVGKNKNFFSFLSLAVIVIGLSAGVVLVTSKSAVFTKSQAKASCAQWNESCMTNDCCSGQGLTAIYDNKKGTCACVANQCNRNDVTLKCSSDGSASQKCVNGKFVQV